MNETLKRFLSGVVYVTLLLTATYTKTSFFILFGIFMLIAIYEFCQLTKLNIYLPLLFGCSAYFLVVGQYITKIDLYLLIITLLVSVKCVFLLFNSKSTISQLSKYIFVLGYATLPFIFIAKVPFGESDYNPKIIISIFIIIWTNDTFAYLVGKTIGKHKLFESVSPKKTLEGFIGGFLFSIIAAVLISRYYFNPKINYQEKLLFIWTVTAIIISVFSTLGDLIESKFKRIAGVKDSGKIMPGHGGVLDRLDSIIFVAPFVYLFYKILNHVS